MMGIFQGHVMGSTPTLPCCRHGVEGASPWDYRLGAHRTLPFHLRVLRFGMSAALLSISLCHNACPLTCAERRAASSAWEQCLAKASA